jgi:hypothetical protein
MDASSSTLLNSYQSECLRDGAEILDQTPMDGRHPLPVVIVRITSKDFKEGKLTMRAHASHHAPVFPVC